MSIWDKEGITVYLDESLKRFETVYPAAGNDHSAVRLTIAELEDVARGMDGLMCVKENFAIKQKRIDKEKHDMVE